MSYIFNSSLAQAPTMKKTAIAVFFIFKFFSFFALFSHQNAYSKAYFSPKIDSNLLILLVLIKKCKNGFLF
mgnify:CR=1 FL=1